MLSFTCKYAVSVRRGFLFLLVLRIGYVIFLWHSLGILYNYFQDFGSGCTSSWLLITFLRLPLL